MYKLRLLLGIGVIGASFLTHALPASADQGLLDLLVDKGTITEEEAKEIKKKKRFGSLDRVKFYGDFRLRQEFMWYDSDEPQTNGENRNRQRFRLRLGGDFQHGKNILYIRLISGDKSQTSGNQTLQNLSDKKGIWIDRAFIELKQIPHTALWGGRMANPFYKSLTGDLVFDSDYNPEGFAQLTTLKLNPDTSIFINTGQFLLDGGGAGSDSQWLLGYQGGAEHSAGAAEISVALLFYHLANPNSSDFDAATVQPGNTRVSPTDPTLINNYRVLSPSVSVTFPAALPVTVSVDAVKNFADTVQDAARGIEDEDLGYMAAVRLGRASAAKTFEAGYQYRRIETDATLADLADSDLGPGGGTNIKGHKIWAAFSPTKATKVLLTYYNGKILNTDLLPAPVFADDENPAHNRVQINYMFKFR
ncbi:MAG TPA: putative porin [Nitrospiria bacterium]